MMGPKYPGAAGVGVTNVTEGDNVGVGVGVTNVTEGDNVGVGVGGKVGVALTDAPVGDSCEGDSFAGPGSPRPDVEPVDVGEADTVAVPPDTEPPLALTEKWRNAKLAANAVTATAKPIRRRRTRWAIPLPLPPKRSATGLTIRPRVTCSMQHA
jgi:hypothetical protein